jgi:drug/metabolite transporter (DMT)-like permease
MRSVRIARAEHLHWYASIPAVGLIGMTVFNYLALEWVAPSVHLTILRLNILLLGLLAMIGRNELRRRSWLMMSFLLLSFVFALTAGSTMPWGIGLSLLAMFSYTFYSLVSEHILQQRKISVRYPLFLFSVGLYLGIAGLLLVPLQQLSAFQTPLVLPAILYVLVCVCFPHACYSALLKRTRFTHVTHLFLAEVPLAVLFEIAILGVILPPLLYGAIAIILLLLFFQSWRGLSLASET